MVCRESTVYKSRQCEELDSAQGIDFQLNSSRVPSVELEIQSAIASRGHRSTICIALVYRMWNQKSLMQLGASRLVVAKEKNQGSSTTKSENDNRGEAGSTAIWCRQ